MASFSTAHAPGGATPWQEFDDISRICSYDSQLTTLGPNALLCMSPTQLHGEFVMLTHARTGRKHLGGYLASITEPTVSGSHHTIPLCPSQQD